MDTDDCTAEQRRRFINKEMFKNIGFMTTLFLFIIVQI